MKETLLPNGSIVLLKGGNKKLMVYGRKQLLVTEEDVEKESDDLTMYDYIGVPYPEGYVNPEHSYVFNHSDIEDIIFTGFVNEEEDEFQDILRQV
ncbi:DUF4176 domain-containing protein [Salipaludibacillus sp. LMS25]|jgi:hypothetical protein|uniref:DUF4176 domain-containing protein n=1 Tax=Salipaludibacillus sp. LMS25 TaxID=2924031 RepID=UPI0020D18E3E|nr:DUF4176 domain-containing protein [Salipaludibacillus sp. LMS25]UTR14962.1 DUF4176 domain-containing protein [Salipaludibacillus sp. LMS25]